MNPNIFRAYDIRGVADTELTDDLIEDLGRALGTLIREKGGTNVAVGRDCRVSGPRLKAAIARGLASTGLEVIDIGEVPTPILYFATVSMKLGGGVQVTGSHNPPEFNGFKMMAGGDTLHGEDIIGLRDRIIARDFATGVGTVREIDIVDDWINFVVENIHIGPRKLKVVVDGGNGVGGPTAMRLLSRLGIDAIGQFIEPDGTFPNHHPDPTTLESVEILAHAVRENHADLGIGFDGDADRIGVVDHNGDVLWGDKLMILFSRSVLADVPGATIVSEVKCSKTLYDDIARHGGNGIMWRTGHSPIKAKMKLTGALLGGEMSGHIFFKHRYFGFDDAIYAAARLIEIATNSAQSLGEMLSDVPLTFATPEIRVDCPDDIKFAVVERVVAEFKSKLEVNDIDGARVTWPDGWGLVRASNTQPVLVLRAEAESPERRDEILAFIQRAVADAEAAFGASR